MTSKPVGPHFYPPDPPDWVLERLLFERGLRTYHLVVWGIDWYQLIEEFKGVIPQHHWRRNHSHRDKKTIFKKGKGFSKPFTVYGAVGMCHLSKCLACVPGTEEAKAFGTQLQNLPGAPVEGLIKRWRAVQRERYRKMDSEPPIYFDDPDENFIWQCVNCYAFNSRPKVYYAERAEASGDEEIDYNDYCSQCARGVGDVREQPERIPLD